jgi:hypothetical protein
MTTIPDHEYERLMSIERSAKRAITHFTGDFKTALGVKPPPLMSEPLKKALMEHVDNLKALTSEIGGSGW